MIKPLLAKNGVNPDSKNINDLTPLWAAEKRDDVIMKLLIIKDGVDPDFKDNYSRTPLSKVAANG